MILRIFYILLVLSLLPATSFPFSNVFTTNKGAVLLEKPLKITFPLDHGAHEEFTTEWWYLTANLKDETGKTLGIQWTLFRSSQNEFLSADNTVTKTENSSWNDQQIWMGHATVTSENFHYFQEKLARGGTGQAGVNGIEFSAWIDDWSFFGKNDWTELTLKAKGKNFEYNLDLQANGPIVLNGDAGYSVKTWDGHSSAYYSQPFLSVKGEVIVEDQTFLVSGHAWIDREWSSSLLGPEQKGWDWFSLHLNDREKLMLFRVRDAKSQDYFSGTLVTRTRGIIKLKNNDFEITPLAYTFNKDAGSNIPIKWKVEIPSQKISVITNAINAEAFNNGLVPYWEGPISFHGSHHGMGYLEMTGY